MNATPQRVARCHDDDCAGPDPKADRANTRKALAAIYLAAYGETALPESQLDAENFVNSTIKRHSRRAGFRLVVATTDDRTSGYAYGFTGKHGQFWSDWLSGAAPADIVETWVGDHFELVDIVVDPAYRGQGIAGLLHDRSCTGCPRRRPCSPPHPMKDAAARLYGGRGWQVLVPEIDGAKALYGLDLAGRTA